MTYPGGGDSRNANVVLTADTSQYQAQMGQSAQSTNLVTQAVGRLTTALDGITKRAGKKLFQFSAADFAVLGGATAAAATFEKQLGTLRATATVTGQSFGQMQRNIENTFNRFPVARSEVIGLTEVITNLGVTGTKQISDLTNVFIKLGAATGENSGELAAGLTQLSRLMGTQNTLQIGNYANALLTVSKNAGVSASGVLSFAQAIAPLARQAGIGESAVLGISTAFSKAGADGYVAANTFNSLVSDITNLVQTGSPQLEKYARLIGVSADAFAKMDKTTAIVDIFEAINKQGPRAIQTLNQLGFEGIRAQAAISAVVQSGNLQQSVAQAMGASNDQKNLNAGAAAGFKGLTNELIKLRDNFTQLATEIGTPLLGPLESIVGAFNKMFEVLNKIIKPFAPLISAVGAFAGALTAMGGAALVAFGLVTKLATLKWVLGGSGIRAFREGMAVGRDSTVTNESAVRAQEGTLRWYQRPFFYGGAGIGRTFGPGQEGGTSLIGRILGAPISAATWATNMQANFLRDSMRDAYQRTGQPFSPTMGTGGPSTGPMGFFGTMRYAYQNYTSRPTGAPFRPMPGPYADPMSQQAANPRPMPFPRPLPGPGGSEAAAAEAAATTRTISTMSVLSTRTAALAGAFAKLGVETLATTAKLGAAAARFTGGALLNAGRSALSSPLGILGLSFALPGIINWVSGGGKNYSSVDGGNNIQKYDAKLGESSSNLATFSSAVTRATDRLNSLAGKPPANVQNVSATDVATGQSGTYKVVDNTFGKFGGKGRNQAAVAYIQSLAAQHGGIDAQYLQQIKLDLINQYGAPDAQQIINSYLRTLNKSGSNANLPRINYGALGNQANDLDGKDLQNLTNQVFTSVQSQYQNQPNQSSSRAQLQAILAYSVNALAGRKGVSAFDSGIGENLSQQFGRIVGHGPLYQLENGSNGIDFTNNRSDLYNTLLGSSVYGQTYSSKDVRETQGANRTYLKQLGVSDADIAMIEKFGDKQNNEFLKGYINRDQLAARVGQYASKLIGNGQFQVGYSQTESKALNNTALGKFAQSNTDIANVSGIGSLISNPQAQLKAQTLLQDKALSLSGSLDKAATSLDKLGDTAENQADPALASVARAAAAFQRSQFEQTVLPTRSRADQTAYYAQRVKETTAEYAQNPTQTGLQQKQEAQAAYNQQIESNRQYLISLYSQTKSYNTQIERTMHDYYQTRFRQQRDFNTQMDHANRDFMTQQKRMERDYAIQMQRQAEDSAKSIYDPYQRVYDQRTADAQTVLQNLQDQNQRIGQQYAQLQQLRRRGVSQQAIDMLGLADPSNAQQLDQLTQDITNDPRLIRAINASISQRQSATTKLTQSSFNQSFRRSQEDFTRGFNDMTHDFNVQRQDSIDAFHRGLDDMATDLGTTLDRQQQDFVTSITEITGSFEQMFPQVFDQINGNLRKYAPQAADIIQQQLDKLHVNVFGNGLDSNGNSDPGGAGIGGGPMGTKSNPSTTPNTSGINPKGQFGYYDPKGGFHKEQDTPQIPGSPSSGNPIYIAPPTSGSKNNSPAAAQAYARSQLSKYGWGQGEMAALITLWNHESNWDYKAYNPSGAHGIPQAMPMYPETETTAWKNSASMQVDWGLRYIKNRYGSPSAAWNFWEYISPGENPTGDGSHWYDHGGVLPPGIHRTVNATGMDELVLNPAQMKALHTAGKGTQAMNIFKIYNDNSMTFKDITVQASDPNKMAKELQARARLAKLSSPPRSTAGNGL